MSFSRSVQELVSCSSISSRVGACESGSRFLIALKLRWVLVDLRGHITENKMQYFASSSCSWLVRCHGIPLFKV